LLVVDREGQPMKLHIAGVLASLLLATATCDGDPEEPDVDDVITPAECAELGGRQSPNPGGGAPPCSDDEVQIAWVLGIEYGRCCIAR
jgi:hypothetical protein